MVVTLILKAIRFSWCRSCIGTVDEIGRYTFAWLGRNIENFQLTILLSTKEHWDCMAILRALMSTETESIRWRIVQRILFRNRMRAFADAA